MFRWFQDMIVRRACFALLLVCLGCSAQAPVASSSSAQNSAPAQASAGDITTLIEHQVRARFSLPPDVKVIVGPLQPSDFPNYDALVVTLDSPEKKQPLDFLLSRDHKMLMRITKMDLSKDPYAEIMKKIDVRGRPTRGNKDAKVVVVNYDDFECPFCSKLHTTLFPDLFKEYSDRVLFIYKDYPLEDIHPWAVHAAVDANCLSTQNPDAYWDYADYLHNNSDEVTAEFKEKGHAASAALGKGAKKDAAENLFREKGREAAGAELDKQAVLQGQKHNLDLAKLESCLKAQDEKPVRASMGEGELMGVSATPTMFINGAKLDGAVPADSVRAALDQALKDSGVAPPEHKSTASEGKTAAAK